HHSHPSIYSHRTTAAHSPIHYSLHDALPISRLQRTERAGDQADAADEQAEHDESVEEAGRSEEDVQTGDDAGQDEEHAAGREQPDRKSTRLNSSHRTISYAVFCLKKKKTTSS